MGLENNAITEYELFSSVVGEEVLESDREKELMQNISLMLTMVPRNIFKNEYYVLYEAIKAAKGFNVILSYKHFNQIILNNIEKLLNSSEINIEEFATDSSDKNLVKEEFIQMCMASYETLSNERLNSARFPFNVELYVKAWVEEKFREYLFEAHEISTEGKTIRGKYLQGSLEAHKYFNSKSTELHTMLNIGEQTMKSITVSPDGYQAYLESKQEDKLKGKVSRTGINEIDETIGELGKGTVLVIQGPPAGGKSRMSSNIAHQAVIEGHSGVYFALEGSPRRTLCLFLARHLVTKYNIQDVTDNDIFEETYDPSYAEIIEAAEYDLFNNPKYGRLKIIPSPVYDEEIEGMLETIWDTEFKFDWVAIDYSSLIRSKVHESVTNMLSNLMPLLETMAGSFRGEGFLLIFPHQLTKETVNLLMKGEDRTLTGSADSSAVMKSAHICLTIYTDEELKIKDMAKIFCTKSRHSSGFSAKEVYAKLGCCYFNDLPE